MSARLKRPHRTPSEIVDGLEQIGLVITAERLRNVRPSAWRVSPRTAVSSRHDHQPRVIASIRSLPARDVRVSASSSRSTATTALGITSRPSTKPLAPKSSMERIVKFPVDAGASRMASMSAAALEADA